MFTKFHLKEIFYQPDKTCVIVFFRVERIYLQNTGIKSLDNDFEEVATLPGVKNLTIRGGNMTYVQSGYFKLFPNLKVMQFLNVNFSMMQRQKMQFHPDSPLEILDFINNDFSSFTLEDRTSLLEYAIVRSKMMNNGRFDFSNNNLLITEACLKGLDNIAPVRTLSLRNNKFADFLTLANAFKNFTNLVTLDLSGTAAPK